MRLSRRFVSEKNTYHRNLRLLRSVFFACLIICPHAQVQGKTAVYPEFKWYAHQTIDQPKGGINQMNLETLDLNLKMKGPDVDQWFGLTVNDDQIYSLILSTNKHSWAPELSRLRKLHTLQLNHITLHSTIEDVHTLHQDLKGFSVSEKRFTGLESDHVQSRLNKISLLSTMTNLRAPHESQTFPRSFDLSDQFVSLPIWLVVILTVLAVIGGCLVSINAFNQYKRSRASKSNDNDLDADQLVFIAQRINYLIEIANSNTDIAQQGLNQNEATKDFASSIKSLRDALDERDQEIKRLKKGYDNAIYRKFVSRFIRIYQAVQYFLQQTDDSAPQLESIHSLLEDALLECDVHVYNPDIGSDYRTAFGVSDYPKILDTDIEEDDCKIAEVLEDGYYMKGGQKKEVLIPARVAIYRFNHKHN